MSVFFYHLFPFNKPSPLDVAKIDKDRENILLMETELLNLSLQNSALRDNSE